MRKRASNTDILGVCRLDLAGRASIGMSEMTLIRVKPENILRNLMKYVIVLSNERIPNL